MVFGDRDDNFVTRVDICQAVTVSDEVQRLRRVFRKENLLRAFRVDELLYARAGVFVNIGGLNRQRIRAGAD